MSPGGTLMFSFRDLTPSDRPLIARWLAAPHVTRWWGEPDALDDIFSQIDDPRVVPQIVLDGSRPIAYVQDYRVHGWKNHPLAFLPDGARGIDTFIGDPADTGQGVGPAYIEALATRLFADGAPALGIDPHPENTPAIRAYQKAGFIAQKPMTSDWGEILPMTRAAPNRVQS